MKDGSRGLVFKLSLIFYFQVALQAANVGESMGWPSTVIDNFDGINMILEFCKP